MGTLRNGMTGWLLAAAILSATVCGCVGTPMPIPPSVDADRISVVLDPEGCESPEAECVRVTGLPGTTEPSSTVFIHSIRNRDLIEPLGGDTYADADGSFEVSVPGPPEGLFRVVVHSFEASNAVNFRVETDVTDPWPVVEIGDEDLGLCIELSTDGIDFGERPLGTTTTEVVNITNICDDDVSFMGFSMAPFLNTRAGDFGAMAPAGDLSPGESTGVVVAFWPSIVADHFGVLLLDMIDPVGVETVRMSLPVRGRGAP